MQPKPEADAEPAAWHAATAEETATKLATGLGGLAQAEAAARFERHGPNRLPEAETVPAWRAFLDQFRSPLVAILLVAAGITAALGDVLDTVAILAVLVLNAVIGFVQERRAGAAVRALAHLVAPTARVVRDGQARDLPAAELVPGDLVLLESGNRVAADLRLVAANTLHADESALTGESLPVAKDPAALPRETALADRANLAHAGTVVVRGRGRGLVVATGTATTLGQIATGVQRTGEAKTPLQHRMDRLVNVIAVAVGCAALLAFGIGLLRGVALAELFVTVVALGVSAVPEGLPIALTVALAVGVRRMAERRAIIRRLPAVETLGSTTVIGTDKTGTLTENRMAVSRIWAAGRFVEAACSGVTAAAWSASDHEALPEAHRLTLLAGVLASEAAIRQQDGRTEFLGDPTETALLDVAARFGLDPACARACEPLLEELPFESERRFSASVCGRPDARRTWVKGAPERVVELCDRMLGPSGVEPLDRQAVLAAAGELAGDGLRVLALASRDLPFDSPVAIERELSGLTLLGLEGMWDPPRAGVQEAVAACRRAGVRVVMITGDHAATARSIAAAVGIAPAAAPVLVGADLDRLDDEGWRTAVGNVDVYARVDPTHKLRIVRALQARGEVVAITGDGVNDAPALRAADIGVAMGRGGTDVAREAGAMVLADDNFATIRAAVEEGRATFNNVRRVAFFLVSCGAAEVLTVLAALALGWPVPFLPAQLLWLNLVTDSVVAIALAFEPAAPDLLDRPPRPQREGIISPLLWRRGAVAAVAMAAATLAVFRWQAGGDLAAARTTALTAMVVFQICQAANARSARRSLLAMVRVRNRAFLLAAGAALAIHLLALVAPPTQTLLRAAWPSPAAWLGVLVGAAAVIAVFELDKALGRRPGATAR